jgi:hypothetical protein
VLAGEGLLSTVYSQVCRQVALVARAIITMRTCKRLLSTVQPQVSRQAALLSESRVAVLAGEGLLSTVYPQVPRQAALVACAIMAMRTCKRLLSTVQPQVPRQAALVACAPMTMRTCKRLLSTVQPQVCRQVVLPCELRVAVLANVHHHLAPARLALKVRVANARAEVVGQTLETVTTTPLASGSWHARVRECILNFILQITGSTFGGLFPDCSQDCS